MNNIYEGIFKEELKAFVDYKISNGFSYQNKECYLKEFDRYTINKKIVNKELTKEIVLGFINTHANIKNRTKNCYASIFRQFGIYLNINDIKAYIIPEKYFPSRYDFHPYIYSEKEIKDIFNALNNCYLKKVPKKQYQVKLILLLLFRTGMRIGEVLTIKRKNIDYEKNSILLENTKNGSDRLILLSNELTQKLYDFETQYNNNYEYYFENNAKHIYSVNCFNHIFVKLLYYAKIMHTENGPRVHDARHTFCVNSLKQAIDNNLDLNTFIPLLSAYIGHTDLDSTYKYLHLTYELYPDIREKTKEIINLEKEIHYEEF